MKNFNKISKEKWIQLKRNADMYEVVGYQFGKNVVELEGKRYIQINGKPYQLK